MVGTAGAGALEETEKTIVQASKSAHGRPSHSQAPAPALYTSTRDSRPELAKPRCVPVRAGDNRSDPIAQALLEIKAALHITS